MEEDGEALHLKQKNTEDLTWTFESAKSLTVAA
jgi:hypothetical protein